MSRPTHSIDEAGWARFVARHGVGDVIDGEVVKVVPFGAFVRVGEGVDGLAPQSLWPTLPTLGSRIPLRIAAIDVDNRRVALGPA
jgi:small subunit ribosomal protein S1